MKLVSTKLAFTLLLALLTGSAYGAVLCPECQTDIVIDDVSGGLATTLPDYKIGKSFSPYMRNVYVDNGKIELFKGYKVAGSTDTLGSVTGIFPYVKEDGTKQFIVTDSSVILTTQDFQFYVFIASAQNPNVLTRCGQVRNNMWCMNGIDSAFTWDGSAKTVLDGTNGTPNVPIGKFMEYYQDRVFIYSLNGNASQARYSDVVSTNGVIIAPDNYLAWPALNLLNIGQGDGQVGTAIWIEDSQLQFGKERSIYTLFGTNRGSYLPRKTSPDIGVVSQDSVRLVDGVVNFLGPDGVYVGRTRVTDHIVNEIDSVDKTIQKTGQNLWDTQPEFEKGQLYGSTVSAVGILSLGTKEVTLTPTGTAVFADFAIPGASPMTAATTFYGPIRMDFRGHWGDQSLYMKQFPHIFTQAGGGNDAVVKVILENLYTGQTVSTISLLSAGTPVKFSSQTIFEGWQVNASSLALHYEYVNSGETGGAAITIAFDITTPFILQSATTGQYVSDIASNTTVSSWGNFGSNREDNGGTINYYVKTGTDPVNIAASTKTWVPITPGGVIGSPPGETYVQWAATITTVSSYTSPTVDYVTIDHVEGAGASNRAFAEKWKSRYWLFTSTGASNLSLLFIRARNTSTNPVAWMPGEGMNMRSMVSDGETLYAGSASTGTFYILDSGTNFNGSPVVGIYDTRATYMGNLFNEKMIYEYYVADERASGKTLTLGLSIDGGDYTNQTLSLDGSGAVVKTFRNVQPPVKGKLFRWRFTHSGLDQDFNLKNFGVLYKPTNVRKNDNE